MRVGPTSTPSNSMTKGLPISKTSSTRLPRSSSVMSEVPACEMAQPRPLQETLVTTPACCALSASSLPLHSADQGSAVRIDGDQPYHRLPIERKAEA